jgi:BAI1-associated protein 3
MTQRTADLKMSDSTESSKKFEVTKEWCCALNNLDYMRDNLEKMVEDFGVGSLNECLSETEKRESLENLETIIRDSLERQLLHIEKFINEISGRMAPNLARYLTDGAAHLHEDCGSMDKTMAYLEDSLTVLNAELSPGNFERIMDKVWLEICRILEIKTQFTTVSNWKAGVQLGNF